MGEVRAHTRVEARNLFCVLPGLQPAALQPGCAATRRLGPRPDMVYRLLVDGAWTPERLLELKTVHYSPTRYRATYKSPGAAVAARAVHIPPDYRGKCRTLDRRYAVPPPPHGQPGPAEARLDQFDKITCVVVGAIGEFSEHLHELVSRMAEAGAQHFYREMLCQDVVTAQAVLTWQIRSRLYFAAVSESAHLLLERLQTLVHRDAAGPCPRPGYPPPARARDWKHQWTRAGGFAAALRDAPFRR